MRRVLLLGLSIVALSTASFSTHAAAAPAKTPPPAPSVNSNNNTLKISPVRTDVTIQPGESKKVQVIVTNLTDTAVFVKPIENDFVAGDEKGTPSIILDENSYAPTHSLKRFMLPLKNVTVPAKGSQTVDVTITVPQSAQAGGYFGAIRFAPTSPDGSKNVNINASVASLILMTVPGDLVEQLALTNFDIQQNGGSASNFRTPDNLEVLLRFRNAGNVQVAPFGQINVLKGEKVVYKTAFNGSDPKDTVLPDSARRWNVPLKNLGKFGKYTVVGNFTYGTSNKSIEIKKTIWIIPTMYIFGAIGGLILLILIIVFVIWFLKSYKKRILRSSRRY